MIGPALSLFPGQPDPVPLGPEGGQRRWYGTVLSAIGLAALLGVLAVTLHLLLRPATAGDARIGSPPAATPRAAPGGDTGPDVARPWTGTVRPGDARPALGPPNTPAQFVGTSPFEAVVDHPGGLMLVRMAYRGEGAFAVEVAPEGARRRGLVVDVTGPYQGTRAFGMPEGSYRLGVTSDDRWGVTIEQPRYGRAGGTRLPTTLAGVGDTATRPFEVTTDRPVTMVWAVESDRADGTDGASVLEVRVLDLDGATVDEFTAGHAEEVERELPAGTYLLDVTTSAGVWRVAMS